MNLSIPLKPFRTFGGAKVPHRKHTGSSPSEVIPTPEKVRIPMQMHIGAVSYTHLTLPTTSRV